MEVNIRRSGQSVQNVFKGTEAPDPGSLKNIFKKSFRELQVFPAPAKVIMMPKNGIKKE